MLTTTNKSISNLYKCINCLNNNINSSSTLSIFAKYSSINNKSKNSLKENKINENEEEDTEEDISNQSKKRTKLNKTEMVLRKISTLPGSNLKKAINEIKTGKLGTFDTVAKFKEDLTDTTNPANQYIRQLEPDRCSYNGVFWIDNEQQLNRAFTIINKERIISLDIEGMEMGKQGDISLIQIGLMSGRVFLFDVKQLGQTVFDQGLKHILETTDMLKIVHDCRRDSEILYHKHRVSLTHVYDIQIAHALLQKKREGNIPIRRYGLQELIHLYTPKQISQKVVEVKYTARELYKTNTSEIWGQRPLSKLMIDYSALDAIVLHPIYNAIQPLLQSPFDKRFLKKNFNEQLSYFKDSSRELYPRNLI